MDAALKKAKKKKKATSSKEVIHVLKRCLGVGRKGFGGAEIDAIAMASVSLRVEDLRLPRSERNGEV